MYMHNLSLCFVCSDSLHPSQQFFTYVETGLPGLNQYLAEDKVSCSRTQHSALVRLEPTTPQSRVKHSPLNHHTPHPSFSKTQNMKEEGSDKIFVEISLGDLCLSGSTIRKSRFIFAKERRTIRQKNGCLTHSNERIFQVYLQMQGWIKDSWKWGSNV